MPPDTIHMVEHMYLSLLFFPLSDMHIATHGKMGREPGMAEWTHYSSSLSEHAFQVQFDSSGMIIGFAISLL